MHASLLKQEKYHKYYELDSEFLFIEFEKVFIYFFLTFIIVFPTLVVLHKFFPQVKRFKAWRDSFFFNIPL